MRPCEGPRCGAGELARVVANQVQADVHAGGLRSGVGAQGCGVRVFDQVGGDEVGIGGRQVVDDGPGALGFVEAQQAWRQRRVVDQHRINPAAQVGAQRREVLPGGEAVGLPRLRHQVEHVDNGRPAAAHGLPDTGMQQHGDDAGEQGPGADRPANRRRRWLP